MNVAWKASFQRFAGSGPISLSRELLLLLLHNLTYTTPYAQFPQSVFDNIEYSILCIWQSQAAIIYLLSGCHLKCTRAVITRVLTLPPHVLSHCHHTCCHNAFIRILGQSLHMFSCRHHACSNAGIIHILRQSLYVFSRQSSYVLSRQSSYVFLRQSSYVFSRVIIPVLKSTMASEDFPPASSGCKSRLRCGPWGPATVTVRLPCVLWPSQSLTKGS